MNLNSKQIIEMVDRGLEDALFNKLLNEFNHKKSLNMNDPKYFALLTLGRWVKIGKQDPQRMREALKDYLE